MKTIVGLTAGALALAAVAFGLFCAVAFGLEALSNAPAPCVYHFSSTQVINYCNEGAK